jgi:hypothetical protein
MERELDHELDLELDAAAGPRGMTRNRTITKYTYRNTKATMLPKARTV